MERDDGVQQLLAVVAFSRSHGSFAQSCQTGLAADSFEGCALSWVRYLPFGQARFHEFSWGWLIRRLLRLADLGFIARIAGTRSLFNSAWYCGGSALQSSRFIKEPQAMEPTAKPLVNQLPSSNVR